MNLIFKLKKLLGLYKSNSSVWIKVVQTDGIEYSYKVKVSDLDDEIRKMKPLVKSIEII